MTSCPNRRAALLVRAAAMAPLAVLSRGRVHALAVTSRARRMAVLPRVPTLAELGAWLATRCPTGWGCWRRPARRAKSS